MCSTDDHWSLSNNGWSGCRRRSTPATTPTATRTNGGRGHNAHQNHSSVRRQAHSRTSSNSWLPLRFHHLQKVNTWTAAFDQQVRPTDYHYSHILLDSLDFVNPLGRLYPCVKTEHSSSAFPTSCIPKSTHDLMCIHHTLLQASCAHNFQHRNHPTKTRFILHSITSETFQEKPVLG